jgi:rhomboid family protein
MGIYDRDYIRSDNPRRGGGGGFGSPPRLGLAGMSRWSVNTWIIVACIVVHVLTLFSGQYTFWVPQQEYWLDTAPPNPTSYLVGRQPEEVSVVERDPETGRESPAQIIGLRLSDPQTGQAWGWREVVPRTDYTVTQWLHFSTARGFLKLEVWRLVTFQFLHSTNGIFHILFNMFALFFFGPLVERYLGSKRYLAFYLMCGISGALLYLILNFMGSVLGISLPGVLAYDTYTPLVGASAGVFGVLMAGAFVAPNTVVQLLFPPIPLKLKTLAYAMFVIAVVKVLFQATNAGGEAAHIGGAISGFYFIRKPELLRDFFDDFTGLFGKGGGGKRGRSRGGPKRQRYSSAPSKGPSNEEIDRILGKVGTEGLQSLSEREKRLLQQASEQQRRG